MIPTKDAKHDTVTSGVIASSDFKLSENAEDQAYLMAILRDGIYPNPIKAFEREYAANGWDAHRSIGKGDVPLRITLPTTFDSTWRCRDFGPGLSREDVLRVYTQYGASTKRASNDSVGCLGIGSKSAFSYSSSFTITSWHGGTRSTYVAVKYEEEGLDKARVDLLAEEPCDPAETGIEILIATKPGDRWEIQSVARELYQHMVPRPTINTELPALPAEQTVLTNGVIRPGSGEWIAVMGCVPYRVDIKALDAQRVNKCIVNLSGSLSFDIGAVTMSASREELRYTTLTKAKLIAKFDALVDEFVTHALKTLESGALDGWQTRLQIQVLARLDLPLPDKWKPFAEGFAKVTYQPGDFTITHNKAACTRLAIDADTRLLIDDTGNDLVGYSLSADDYVVRSPGKTPAELRAALDAALVTSGLVGVKIELLSSLYWTAPVVPVKKKANPKHRARMFQLKPSDGGYSAPWSDNWEAEQLRVPTKDDVYVLIEGFKAEGYKDFYIEYREDATLLRAFNVTVPAVYGYKTTAKKPIDAAAIEGTHYREWRKTLVAQLLTPERTALIATYWRAQMTGESYSYGCNTPDAKKLKGLTAQLGEQHPLIVLYSGAIEAKALIASYGSRVRTLALRAGLTYSKSTTALTIEALHKRYGLLRRAGFNSLWDSDKEAREEWLDYVRMRDERFARDTNTNNVVQLVSVP